MHGNHKNTSFSVNISWFVHLKPNNIFIKSMQCFFHSSSIHWAVLNPFINYKISKLLLRFTTKIGKSMRCIKCVYSYTHCHCYYYYWYQTHSSLMSPLWLKSRPSILESFQTMQQIIARTFKVNALCNIIEFELQKDE